MIFLFPGMTFSSPRLVFLKAITSHIGAEEVKLCMIIHTIEPRISEPHGRHTISSDDPEIWLI